MKKIKIMLLIFCVFICTSLSISFAFYENATDSNLNANEQKININKNEIEETIIEVTYEYKAETNTVIAKMTSNNELQNTKSTWKLSEDKKQYTFEFNANTTYMSSVVDIYGNVIPVQINVTQVDDKGPEVKVEYIYNEDRTECVIKVTSNEEMIQKTTPGWKLSEDKKVYTYVSNKNEEIITNFTDKYRNSTSVHMLINEINRIPTKIEVTYEYKAETNTVIAKMTSNKELQNTKTTWKLSEDKKQYTFEFNANTTYMSSVVDIYGNVIPVQINVTQVDNKGPEVKVEYIYNEDRTECVIKVTSNEEMIQKTTPGWKLSEDKKEYTYISNKNEEIITNFTDKYRNSTSVHMLINEINRIPTKIEVTYEYKAETNTVIAKMTSNNELQNTKSTWKLSEDKKQYTFEFNANTTYMSSVVDIYGNVIPVQINVTQVDDKGPEVKVEYIYNEDRTECVIKVTSNEEMIQKTTPGWKLSEDKKEYTYIQKINGEIRTNFTDKYRNSTSVYMLIDKIDERPAKVEITYEYKAETNTVIAKMTADRELQNTKSTWKLSEDKKQYTFEFNANTTYMSSVVDIYGNIIPVQINVTQVDDKGPEVKVEYIYNEDKTECIVKVISNEEMIQKTTPGWILSEDKKVYTYVSTKNENIMTNFTDKYGNFTSTRINIVFFLNGIDVSRHNGKIDWQKVKNSGIEFAIIRCGFGQDRTSQDDEMFEYNVSECERLGIPYGVYLYSYAVDLNCANSEADHVLRLIKGKNPTYGIWYDLEEEVDEFDNPIPNEMLVNIAITFCEKMKANGYDYVGIYANLNWFNNKLNDSRLDKYPKWIAQWNDECTYKKEYDMWQYTSDGQVDGINGRVDMNKYYKFR